MRIGEQLGNLRTAPDDLNLLSTRSNVCLSVIVVSFITLVVLVGKIAKHLLESFCLETVSSNDDQVNSMLLEKVSELSAVLLMSFLLFNLFRPPLLGLAHHILVLPLADTRRQQVVEVLRADEFAIFVDYGDGGAEIVLVV